jgi:hypothetical protein
MSIWQTILNFFVRDLVYAFRCVLCGLVEYLSTAVAKEAGWVGQQKAGTPKGWRCGGCAREEREKLAKN